MTVGEIEATPVDARAFGELRARFRGALLRPGEEGYEEARRIWNGAIDRRPAVIARCAGADAKGGVRSECSSSDQVRLIRANPVSECHRCLADRCTSPALDGQK